MLKAKGEDTSRHRGRGARHQRADRRPRRARPRPPPPASTELLLNIPNLPHDACPVGADETANPVVREWGEKPAHRRAEGPPRTRAAALGLISTRRRHPHRRLRFRRLPRRGRPARTRADQVPARSPERPHGYEEVNVPHLVNRECMEGTGQLPKFEDDMYGTDAGDDGRNSLFLAPTAEVPGDQPLPRHDPRRGRPAGENGRPTPRVSAARPAPPARDNRGIIRMHQFDKVELVQIVHPDQSFEVLEELTGHAESVLQKLGLHYRTIELCTGDIGFSAAKTYDIEVWAPGQGKYLEVSSCSCFTDYQARRMKLRFKDADGKNRFCHTLNGSGTALPRLYVALLEQCQQPDGSIRIPEALVPYFGAEVIG